MAGWSCIYYWSCLLLNTSVLNDNFCSCHASSSFYGHLLFHGHTPHMLPHQPTFFMDILLTCFPISQHHPSLPLPTPTFLLPPCWSLVDLVGLHHMVNLLFHVHSIGREPLRHTSPQLSQDARKPGLAATLCGLSWLTGAYSPSHLGLDLAGAPLIIWGWTWLWEGPFSPSLSLFDLHIKSMPCSAMLQRWSHLASP